MRAWSVIAVLLFSAGAIASNSGITYQGRILKPDGAPLSGQFTQFRLQIRTPDAAACLMYEEIQVQDLRNTDGAFSITINDGAGSRIDTSGLTLDRIFANRGTFNLSPPTCTTGLGVYSPNTSDGRNLVVLFKDETMATWEPIAAQKMNFVPLAFEAKQIGGFTSDSLLRVVNSGGEPLTGLAPLSNAQYSELIALANGTSNAFSKAGQLGGVSLPTMSAGEVLGWNGTAWVSQSAVAGPASVTTSMIQANAVDGSKIATGAVGTSQIASDVSISTTGSLASAISTTRDSRIFAPSPSTFFVGMKAPVLSSSYTLTWPLDAGSASQVLTTDGSGNLSWSTPASGNYSNVQTVSNTTGSITMTPLAGNSVIVNSATVSTSSTTGALIVNGGVGIAGAVNSAGNISSGGTVSAVNSVITPQLYGSTSASGDIRIDGTSDSTRGNVLLAASGGNVGIGTTVPSQALHVSSGNILVQPDATWNTGDSAHIYFGGTNKFIRGAYGAGLTINSDNGGSDPIKFMFNNATEVMRLQSSGNVGIGTTNPLSRFVVAEGVARTSFTGTGTGTQHLINHQGTSNYTTLDFGNTGSPAAGVPESRIGSIRTASGSFLQFGTTNSYVAGITNIAMTVDPNGKVGIGTTSPSAALSIKTNGAANDVFNVSYQSSADSTSGTQIADNYGGVTDVSAIRMNSVNANTGQIQFMTNSSGAGLLERMRISAPGNIGIGTTAPSARLHLRSGTSAAGTAPLKLTAGTNLTSPEAGAIEFDGTNLFYTNSSDVRQTLATTTSASQWTTNVNDISYSTGRVGIGTTSPSQTLDVNGTAKIGPAASATGLLTLKQAGTTNTSGIVLEESSGSSTGRLYIDGSSVVHLTKGPNNGAELALSGISQFKYNGTPTMTIDIVGNVGIGTTAPQATLDINGQVRLKTNASAPVACSSTVAGTIALTTAYVACVCNSTSWVRIADGTTACVW